LGARAIGSWCARVRGRWRDATRAAIRVALSIVDFHD